MDVMPPNIRNAHTTTVVFFQLHRSRYQTDRPTDKSSGPVDCPSTHSKPSTDRKRQLGQQHDKQPTVGPSKARPGQLTAAVFQQSTTAGSDAEQEWLQPHSDQMTNGQSSYLSRRPATDRAAYQGRARAFRGYATFRRDPRSAMERRLIR
jgi:hypothetical protein